MNNNFHNHYKLHQKAMAYLEMMNNNRKELERARAFLAEYNNEKDPLAIIRIRNTREDLINGINTIKDMYEILLSSYTDVVSQLLPVAFKEELATPAPLNPIASLADSIHQ